MRNYYSALGVARNATSEEIKAQWRSQARTLHPDRSGGNADGFNAVKEAYEVLRDPKKREAYNREWDAHVASRTRIIPDSESMGDFWGSDNWEKVKSTLFGLAESYVTALEADEEVSNFVADTSNLRISRSKNRLTISVGMTNKQIEKIIEAAQHGMTLDDYAEEVGQMVANALIENLLR